MSNASDTNLSTIAVRVFLLLALTDNKLSPKEIENIRALHAGLTGRDLSAQQLLGHVEWFKENGVKGTMDFLGSAAGSLPRNTLDELLRSAVLMMFSGGVAELDLKVLYAIFLTLGLKNEDISAAIDAVVDKIKASQPPGAGHPAPKPAPKPTPKPAPASRPARPARRIGIGPDNLSVKEAMARSARSEKRAKMWGVAACALLLIAYLGYEALAYSHYKNTQDAQVESLRTSLDRAMGRREEVHRQRLADPEVVSGELAAERQGREWERRLNQDPALAVTKTEKMLVKVAKLADDPNLPDKDVLQKTAALVAPSGSAIKILPRKGGFAVDVSFDMASMTSGESGARTKHHTIAALDREVRKLVFYVMKDLYEHCGKRKLSSISVSCEHGVRNNIGGLPGAVRMRRIFAVTMPAASAGKIHDWQLVAQGKVEKNWTVDVNDFPNLRITSGYF